MRLALALLSSLICTSAYGQFGIQEAMPLSDLTESRLINKADREYVVTPPNPNSLFDVYFVKVSSAQEVCWVSAHGGRLQTNERSKNLEELKAALNQIYGDPLPSDFPQITIFRISESSTVRVEEHVFLQNIIITYQFPNYPDCLAPEITIDTTGL